MPFYEYECASCKFYTEVMQKISDAPLRKCPSCGKSTLKKLVSAPVFRLKGGGWYETDFKSDKESKRNLAGGDDAPDSKSADASSAAGTGDGNAASDKAASDKPAGDKASDSKSGGDKAADGKAADKSRSKPTPEATPSAARSTAKRTAKAPARRAAPKVKAKSPKRRGR
jgi:putative FmdB family regulatory protein